MTGATEARGRRGLPDWLVIARRELLERVRTVGFAVVTELGPIGMVAMIVVPSAAVYEPKFTYIWELAAGRFPDALVKRVTRERAVREIARCFLNSAGMTIPGELARVTGLSRSEAGRGNLGLVSEGYATLIERGVYRLAAIGTTEAH